MRQGEGREALRYYEQEAGELEGRGQTLEAAKARHAFATVAWYSGAYHQGIVEATKALEVFKASPPTQETLERQADLYVLLSSTCRLAGDLAAARRYAREGWDLARALPDRRLLAIYRGIFARLVANVAYVEGDYPEALRLASESVGLLEGSVDALVREGAPQGAVRNWRRQLAWSLWRAGDVRRRLGQLDEAKAPLVRALQMARDVGVPEVEVDTLASLAWLALARREPAEALKYFEQSAAPGTTLLDYSPNRLWSYAGMGWSYGALGREGESLAAFQRSLRAVEDLRARMQEAGLRSVFLEDKQGIYHGAVRAALTLGRADEAFALAERGRARAFLDLLGQTVLSKGKTRALVEEEMRLRAQLSEARALGRGQIEAAERAYRSFLEQVRKENLEQASLMTVEPTTLSEVQALLPEGTTLLENLLTEYATFLWVIDRSRVEVLHLGYPRAMFAEEVRIFRKAIAENAPLEQVRDLARSLYYSLLDPARPHIRGSNLLIVPHDVLHSLPFASLRSPEGRWLIEDFTISTLPSASVLKYLQDKGAGASDKTLAVGNPDVGSALNLRYAAREARAVGARYPGATVLVGAQATEPKVKALSESAGLLHFATHGELNAKDPLSSALLLVPDGQDDGRLEVRKIFGLDLNARLVVLSACETGLGKLSKGDELVGLQRAFLYAGTPAVVTTLWKVDDRASFRLMEAFYADLEAHDPAEALRQAQRATMAEFPHPFAWAAFGLTGSPR